VKNGQIAPSERGSTSTIHSGRAEERMLKIRLLSLISDEEGQDLIEHAVIAGIISILSLIASNSVRGH
jgi:hypothetical protein